MCLISYLPRNSYINFVSFSLNQNEYLFNILEGPVQWKFCHFPETGDVKADAWGKPHGWGWATLFNGIFFGLMFPLFSQFWEA